MSRLDHKKPKSKKDKEGASADADFQMFAAMTQAEAAQWVDDNCAADANTMRILRVIMRTFTALAPGV